MRRQADLGLAYVLLVLGGLIGVHRMYLGRVGTGALMFFIPPVAGFTFMVGLMDGATAEMYIAALLLAVNPVMWTFDFFRLPTMVEPKPVGRRGN